MTTDGHLLALNNPIYQEKGLVQLLYGVSELVDQGWHTKEGYSEGLVMILEGLLVIAEEGSLNRLDRETVVSTIESKLYRINRGRR